MRKEESLSVVQRLTRNMEIMDHRKLLSKSSMKVDEFRTTDGYQTPETFEELKRKVSSSTDLRDMLATINKEIKVADAFNLMFSDNCLAEISRIDTTGGPLVDFPASINQNLYCRIVDYGIEKCPSLIMVVINIVIRRGEPLLPFSRFPTSFPAFAMLSTKTWMPWLSSGASVFKLMDYQTLAWTCSLTWGWLSVLGRYPTIATCLLILVQR